MLNDLEILLIGVLVMLLMALSVIFFVVMYQRNSMRYHKEKQQLHKDKQQEIALASIQSEEEERKRIAAELHDNVGANLSAVNLLLSSYLSNPKDILNVEEAKGLLAESLQSIRGLSYRIHPSPLQKLGLQSALSSYFGILTLSNNTKFILNDKVKISRFDEAAELNVYRIIQELTTNAIKYAKAKVLQCKLVMDTGILTVQIIHDGNGLSQEEFEIMLNNPKGVGLQNVKHRIDLQDGNISLSKSPTESQITITFPLKS